MRFRLLIVVVLTAVLPLGAANEKPRENRHWVATWGTAQLTYRAQPAPAPATPAPTPTPTAAPASATDKPKPPARRFPVPQAIQGLNNQTVRMIVRTSLGGDTIRIRLTQAFGAPTVTIGAAHVALRGKESAIVAGSDRALTFGGRQTAMLYAGQEIVSDPVTLTVPPLADVAVSLYFPGETGPPTNHVFGLRPTYISKTGDFTGAEAIAEPELVRESYYWLSGLDVLAAAEAATLVAFGDSITDGDQSTPDTNGMWPALLAERLQANRATRHIGVVNAGISGNRVLGNNTSALARVVPHAISVPGAKWMTVLEGINDITAATRNPAAPGATSTTGGAPLTAEDLIAAYRQMIAIAHAHGIKVIGCTITPYGESSGFTDAGEAIRQGVNTWIRTSRAFDAVVDFDAATRDPNKPNRFRPEADSPDMLHPANPGYRLMADAIPLTIFK